MFHGTSLFTKSVKNTIRLWNRIIRGIRENLEFFSVLVPFLFYHWSVNDDTCALTLLEQRVTGKHKDELFMQRLVGPIYKMDDSDLNNAFKTLMFALWSFAQWRLGHFDFIAEDLKKIIK